MGACDLRRGGEEVKYLTARRHNGDSLSHPIEGPEALTLDSLRRLIELVPSDFVWQIVDDDWHPPREAA